MFVFVVFNILISYMDGGMKLISGVCMCVLVRESECRCAHATVHMWSSENTFRV